MNDIPSGFWAFSLSFYQQTDVREACLNLQNTVDADVNIVLYMLYLASQRQRISDNEIHRIIQTVSPWRDNVIKPIRAARTNLKKPEMHPDGDAVDSFKTQLMATELEAEKLQQSLLESLQVDFSDATPDSAAHSNLIKYAQMLGIKGKEKSIQTLLNHFCNNA